MAEKTEEPLKNPMNTTIRGLRMSSLFQVKFVEEAMDYIPRDGDLIVASFPKTGTTWVQYIILQITSKVEISPTFDDILTKIFPFIEMTGAETVDKMPDPRMYKHHLPYDRVHKNPKSKVIYIYRHPEDALVSNYHFMRNFHPDELVFDEHFEFYMNGDVSYGRYFEHVLTYLEHEQDGNLLLVSYEKMKKDPRKELLRIAEFLGEEHHRHLVESESVLQNVLEKTSFDSMKKNVETKNPFKLEEDMIFFRKGTIGDGKKTLSAEQVKRLREKAEEIMKGTKVLAEWYN